jgi:hypothetical protein
MCWMKGRCEIDDHMKYIELIDEVEEALPSTV